MSTTTRTDPATTLEHRQAVGLLRLLQSSPTPWRFMPDTPTWPIARRLEDAGRLRLVPERPWRGLRLFRACLTRKGLPR